MLLSVADASASRAADACPSAYSGMRKRRLSESMSGEVRYIRPQPAVLEVVPRAYSTVLQELPDELNRSPSTPRCIRQDAITPRSCMDKMDGAGRGDKAEVRSAAAQPARPPCSHFAYSPAA